MFEGLRLEIIVGLGIPAASAAFFIARHFWEKTKCFHLMQQKIEALDKVANGSHDTHGDLYSKYNELSQKQASTDAKVDLLLQHFGLKK